MRFTVIVERGEESGYVVHCPELKGCWSRGSTIPEALERISEAIAGCLEARIAEVISMTFDRLAKNDTNENLGRISILPHPHVEYYRR